MRAIRSSLSIDRAVNVGKSRIDQKVDVKRAIELRNKGASYAEIGQAQGVSAQAVHKTIAHLLPDNETDVYKQQRADILAKLQVKLLKSIDGDDLKKSSTYQKVGMYGILFDKERLERGQSTENINNMSVVAKIDAKMDELGKLRDKLSDNC